MTPATESPPCLSGLRMGLVSGVLSMSGVAGMSVPETERNGVVSFYDLGFSFLEYEVIFFPSGGQEVRVTPAT